MGGPPEELHNFCYSQNKISMSQVKEDEVGKTNNTHGREE
jgi:hypothetical protein